MNYNIKYLDELVSNDGYKVGFGAFAGVGKTKLANVLRVSCSLNLFSLFSNFIFIK